MQLDGERIVVKKRKHNITARKERARTEIGVGKELVETGIDLTRLGILQTSDFPIR
jgi:hypothetical protein